MVAPLPLSQYLDLAARFATSCSNEEMRAFVRKALEAEVLRALEPGAPVVIDGASYRVSHTVGDDVHLLADCAPVGPWIFSRAQVDAGTAAVKAAYERAAVAEGGV